MHWCALASWKLKRPAVATGFGATSGFPDAPRADDLRLALRSTPTSEGGEFCTDLPINKSRRCQTHGEQELVVMWVMWDNGQTGLPFRTFPRGF